MESKQPTILTAAVSSALFKSVNSRYSLAKLALLESGNWSEIAKSKIDPAEYDSPSLFGYDYACHYWLKKLSFAGDVARLHDEALQSFLAVESGVAKTNHRLRFSSCKSDVEGIISYARRKIESVLGDFDVGEFLEGCGWGPGASSSLKGRDSTVDRKVMEHSLSVTGRALGIMRAYLSVDSSWMRARLGPDVLGNCSPMSSEFHITECGRFDTVPKDMNRRRSIDIQPTANLFLQKGIGKMVRKRLKRCGIDLDDQSRNQRLAGLAFAQGLCTIDLEAASDSVSSELVRLLLPSDWVEWMDKCRTHYIRLAGDRAPHKLEKFSAMGNGFTFELESLIFYALCWGVVRAEAGDFDSPIAVYGDDIIVASKYFERVETVLTECGFTLNKTKSYASGSFYESCGKHYFKGFDVTPPIQKEVLVDSPGLVRCANRLWRWALRMGSGLCLDYVAFQAYEIASELARDKCQFRHLRKIISLPEQPWDLEGDGGLIVPRRFSSDQNGIARLDLFSAVVKRFEGIGSALYHETLRSARDHQADQRLDVMPCYGLVTPRGDVKWNISTRRVYLSRLECPQWLVVN